MYIVNNIGVGVCLTDKRTRWCISAISVVNCWNLFSAKERKRLNEYGFSKRDLIKMCENGNVFLYNVTSADPALHDNTELWIELVCDLINRVLLNGKNKAKCDVSEGIIYIPAYVPESTDEVANSVENLLFAVNWAVDCLGSGTVVKFKPYEYIDY